LVCGLVVGGMRRRVSGRINLNSAERQPPFSQYYAYRGFWVLKAPPVQTSGGLEATSEDPRRRIW